jgi:high-affinity nickel-transport protein
MLARHRRSYAGTAPRLTCVLLRGTRDRAWIRLAGFGSVVALLHVAGWGVFLYYARSAPALAGLGTLAYTFGLRHAFDADHIAAIDNTTRKFLQEERRPMGIGFFFSLGHSSVVLALTAVLTVATTRVSHAVPALERYGGVVGLTVSGVFLLVIGALNLAVLVDVVRASRRMRSGDHDPKELERRLLDRGLLSRLFLRRLTDRIDASWKMYPLGFLFGLGFDTATEVGLLAMAAGIASQQLPILAVLSLPVIFAAGMSLMDTADGAFMCHAYGWAFSNPVRKVYYNITVTSLSVVVAIAIGGIELVQVAVGAEVDFSRLGYVVVGLFVATWLVSGLVWKLRGIERRWTAGLGS